MLAYDDACVRAYIYMRIWLFKMKACDIFCMCIYVYASACACVCVHVYADMIIRNEDLGCVDVYVCKRLMYACCVCVRARV